MTTDERDQLSAFALRVWGYKQGEVVSLMIHLGDRLGLYRAMAGCGPMTAAGLAAATGLQERWLLEWLRGQAAAGLISTEDGEAFEISAEAVAVLADDRESLWFAAGAFAGGAAPPEVVTRLAGAFRSGIGLTYDDLGPAAAQAIERMTEPWTRLALVPLILPALDGVADRLQAGALVADVGCGSGVAVCAMAAAFPGSRFEGLDPSRHAIARALRRAAENGLQNVEFRTAGAEDLPDDNRYDFVMTLDCLHDMPRPAEAAAAIRRAVRPDGTWLIKDIRSGPAWQDNLRNPVLALMYGLSVTSCLSSGLSEPGGAGLGTLGLYPGLAERMCREAGFSRFARHDFDDPVNLYYEVRPLPRTAERRPAGRSRHSPRHWRPMADALQRTHAGHEASRYRLLPKRLIADLRLLPGVGVRVASAQINPFGRGADDLVDAGMVRCRGSRALAKGHLCGARA